MTSDRVSRFKAQRKKLKVLREHREETEPYSVPISPVAKSTKKPKQDDVLGSIKLQQKHEKKRATAPVTASTKEIDALLLKMRSRWDSHQMDLLLGNCRNSVLNSVVGPFGLGSVVAAMDKDGGNVTTVHNAENGVFAKSEDKERYTRQFDRRDYEDGGLGSKRKVLFQKEGAVTDAYTGRETPKDGRTHLDHVISAKEIHEDKLLRLSAGQRQRDKIATHDSNLVPTDSSLNQSKNDRDLIEWMSTRRKDGKTNAEYFQIKEKQAKKTYSTARTHYQREKALAVTKHFAKEIAVSGVNEAGKMGVQQSLGLLLTEFFSACFDEIADAYQNGFRDSLESQSFFKALRIRLARISKRVAARWKDAVVAFKEGAISGFLSNLVTMLMNMLVTTGKRIVRVIREGFMSIMKALKMALFPPKGMTRAEAADAALKLLATGLTVSLGILAEEVVEKSVTAFFSANMPLLAPYASTVSAVFVGAMTGIASALLVYELDKLDVFGVNEQRKHAFVIQELDCLIAESDSSIETMYQTEMKRMDSMLRKLGVA